MNYKYESELSNLIKYANSISASGYIDQDYERAMQTTCKHCNTAYRIDEIRQDRCPFCWRLI